MKFLNIKNLPRDVQTKILEIEVNNKKQLVSKYLVHLNDGWVFIGDDSHIMGFDNKKEIIDVIRSDTRREW